MSDAQAEPTHEPTHEPAEQADELGYEPAREELIEVVQRLEQGGLALEETLALWERGERLAQICQTWLDGARQRLDEVLSERSGEE